MTRLTRRAMFVGGVAATGAVAIAQPVSGGAPDRLARDPRYLGLGWYIRRTASAPSLAGFYGGVLRLPIMRGADHTWFFWGGNGLVMELKSTKVPAPQRFTDPLTAPTIPIWRTFDLDGLIARLRLASVAIVGQRVRSGDREAFILDADRQLIGFRQVSSASRRPWDVAHLRDYRAGGHFIPGVSMLPPDIYGWTSTLHHVPDVEAEVAFYRDVCGFPLLAREGDTAIFGIGYHSGNKSTLEIAPGGVAQPLPKTREDRIDAIIMRSVDHQAINADMKRRGVPIVDDHIQYKSGELSYVGTPSGIIIGFEQRYDPKNYREPREEYPEDAEAHRLWRMNLVG